MVDLPRLRYDTAAFPSWSRDGMAAPEDDRLALDLLIRGFQISRILRLVADLDLADRIAPDEQVDVAELARAADVLPEPLLRAVRALAAFGIFKLDSGRKLSHTPRSLLLRSDAPGSLRESARFWTGTGSWRAWEMLDAALAGDVPHERAWRVGRFAYLRDHPDEARVFDAFMARFPDGRHEAVPAAYDFSKVSLIADIGGGNGEMLRRILAAFPEARGLLIERPDVVAALAPGALAEGRITPRAGDFFQEVPAGADIYLLVRVLHDWPDDDVVRILGNCRASLAGSARLLVVEALLQPDPMLGRPTEYLIDMQMMAMFGQARERTAEEYRSLLAHAGFDLARIIPTRSAISILEALPAAG
jgi:hypothetical protein